MTARTVLPPLLFLAAVCAGVYKLMQASVLAGILAASVIGGVLILYAAYRFIGTGKGQHVAPRGWAEAGERLALPCERVIPRAPTEHAPPWGHAPFTSLMRAPEPEHAIEPAAVISGPPEPGPDAYFIATGTVSGGRLTSVRAAVLPPLPHWTDELMPPVAALLGHASVDAALDSIFTRAMSRQVRELTDGAA